jgi:predicted DNA-binding transcriptional regulator AlpA
MSGVLAQLREIAGMNERLISEFADDLLTEREVREFVTGRAKPITPTTLWRWRKQGKWPEPYKIGGRARWPRSVCIEARRKLIEEGAA